MQEYKDVQKEHHFHAHLALKPEFGYFINHTQQQAVYLL